MEVGKGTGRAAATKGGKSKPSPKQGHGGQPGSLNCRTQLGGQREPEAPGPVWIPAGSGAPGLSINTGSRLTCPLSRESAGLEFHCLE